MTAVTARSYHLLYMVEEDRILFSVDVAPGEQIGVMLTRRFMRNFLAAFAKLVSERTRPAQAAANPLVRDTILDFEHSQSVANAIAEGSMRDEPRPEPQAVSMPPPKLVQEVKISPQPQGGLALHFINREHALTLEIGPDRVHMVIETFVQIAERAGWDFPPIASWLDPAKAVAPAAKTVN